jgi:hypothetical protein
VPIPAIRGTAIAPRDLTLGRLSITRHWPAHHAVNQYSSRAYSSRAKLPGWAEQLTRIISDDRLAEYDKSIRIDRSGELPLQDTARMPQIEKDLGGS